MRFERRQHYTDAPVQECPECSGPVHRVIGTTGIIFKGSGFYVTDNRKSGGRTEGNGSSKSSEKTSEAKSEAKPSAKTEKTEAKNAAS